MRHHACMHGQGGKGWRSSSSLASRPRMVPLQVGGTVHRWRRHVWPVGLHVAFGDSGLVGAMPGPEPKPQPPSRPSGAVPAVPAYDPLRDGPLRFLGYANEVGEAFRPLVSVWAVFASYGVSLAYVLVDTFDKYRRTLRRYGHDRATIGTSSPAGPAASGAALASVSGEARRAAALSALDTLVWQLLASVILPGYIIHEAVHLVCMLVDTASGAWALGQLASAAAAVLPALSAAAMADMLAKALPTATGLLLIPVIAPPLDHAVEVLLDATLRPWLGIQRHCSSH